KARSLPPKFLVCSRIRMRWSNSFLRISPVRFGRCAGDSRCHPDRSSLAAKMLPGMAICHMTHVAIITVRYLNDI
ncbi:hypothetical protein, partial [Xanthomonas graminis]